MVTGREQRGSHCNGSEKGKRWGDLQAQKEKKTAFWGDPTSELVQGSFDKGGGKGVQRGQGQFRFRPRPKTKEKLHDKGGGGGQMGKGEGPSSERPTLRCQPAFMEIIVTKKGWR